MFKGHFKKGKNTTKNYQLKKYCTFMNNTEKEAIIDFAKNVKRIKLSKHLRNKGITFDTKVITDTLKKCSAWNIIEYTIGNKEDCVLFRSCDKQYVEIDGKMQVCYLHFVIGIKSNVIVSAWYRESSDSFKRPNFKHNYSRDIKISL